MKTTILNLSNLVCQKKNKTKIEDAEEELGFRNNSEKKSRKKSMGC